MKEQITSYLLAFAGLTELVGNRVQWARRPQASALPAVVLNGIGGVPDYIMSGPSGLVSSRVQIDCWGATYASAEAVSRQVLARLNGVRFISGGVTFQGIFAEGESDSHEVAPGGTDIYRVTRDFILWHGA